MVLITPRPILIAKGKMPASKFVVVRRYSYPACESGSSFQARCTVRPDSPEQAAMGVAEQASRLHPRPPDRWL